MSKPKEEEELTVDFWDEVEDEVDEDMALEDEDQEEELDSPDTSEDQEEDEPSDDNQEDEQDEDDQQDDPDGEEEEEPEDDSVVGTIQRQLGYEFEEEFEDSEEGIQLLVEAAGDKKAEEALNSYFEQYPDVQELLEYRRMGGDPDKFFQTRFPEVDYSEVELKEEDERQQEQIVRQELKQVRGYSDEEIQAELEDYRNGGILENKAKRALSALKVKQQEEKESLLEEQRETQRQQQQKIEDYWNGVKETLNKNTQFNGVRIPSSDKDKFYEYLHKPVEDGKSQAMLKAQEADLETRLAIDYLLYKDFDFSGLVDRRAKDKNAKTLKERLQKAKLNKKTETSSDDDYTEELDLI